MPELAPLIALAAPFVLFPIEIALPYPFIFEELAKLAYIYQLRKLTSTKVKISLAILAALLFTGTETVLYTFNAFNSGGLQILILRFFFTAALHSLTSLVILFFITKNKTLKLTGLFLAMLIHLTYNNLVS